MRSWVGETAIEALSTTLTQHTPTTWTATVRHEDGRHWSAAVTRSEPHGLRAPSCGKAPEPYSTYEVEILAQPASEDAPGAAR